MTDVEVPAGVGWTALLAAYGRAQESREANGLFRDPLSSAFVEAVGVQAGDSAEFPRLGPAVDDDSSTLWTAFRFYFAQRTAFYDQRILEAVEAGCRQVVLLGAGLDSRAFRLGLPESIKVFEVDQAPVLRFKQAVLTRCGALPDCDRIPLTVDVRTDWREALTSVGFDLRQPAIWVAEGLLTYLSRSEADLLLHRITTLSADGSRFTGEYFSRTWHDHDVTAEAMDKRDRAAWRLVQGELRYGPVDESPADWLEDHRWAHRETTTIAELGSRHNRAIPPEFGRPGCPLVWLFDSAFLSMKDKHEY